MHAVHAHHIECGDDSFQEHWKITLSYLKTDKKSYLKYILCMLLCISIASLGSFYNLTCKHKSQSDPRPLVYELGQVSSVTMSVAIALLHDP